MQQHDLPIFYRVGPRSRLVQGDRFSVSGGPRYRMSDGSCALMAERGNFVFLSAEVSGGCTFLHAVGDRGRAVRLHVSGNRENPMIPDLECRPYRVKILRKKG